MGTKDKRVFVYNCKPNRDVNLISMSKTDMDILVERLIKRYRAALAYNRVRIDHTLEPLYKKPINFSDRTLSDVIAKIKHIIAVTDKDIDELVESFNTFFGYEVSFFKTVGNKEVPVSPDSICEAFKAIQNQASKEEVSQILYN